MKSTIRHDAGWFETSIRTWIDKGDLNGAIEVISREGQPGELLAVVRSYEDFYLYYCNGKTYKTYQHAYAAIGAAIDRVNPNHQPLTDQWVM
ncbi:hypothetical protein [Falsarthrobacter nasiphocae]|jgi:hypothetical protein|uniref:hypothetical protein n=1 Tax=Falsarthrobacter nasiphocae TaxID=189863 RepID=UPI0031DDC529